MNFRNIAAAVILFGFTIPARAQTAAPPAQVKPAATDVTPEAAALMEKRVETFLRNMYAWGADFDVKAGPVSPSMVGAFYSVPVVVSSQGRSDSAVVYVTKDGKYMFRGEIQDLADDPLAATRRDLHLEGYASEGPDDAKVVLVEFADFECPSCRQLDQLLRALLPKYPQVRLVFKDFPLEEIHPWAMTAAIAGRCVLQQSPQAFWKFHDAVYDAQDLISPENAVAKLTDLASAAGAPTDKFNACLADPKTPDAVHKSLDEGHALDVSATPTTFVDGRRLVGPDPTLLEQFIQFDLKQTGAIPPTHK